MEASNVKTPYIPSQQSFISRASSATYVDSEGLIKTATTNYLLYSEEFDQSPWIATGMLAFGSGSTADAITAPDGTITADLLTENLSTGVHEIRQISSYQSGVTYTWSIFFKAASGTRNLQIILSTGAFLGNPYVNVNPTTGEVINSSDINASVQPYPNGWYRASFSATADASSADQFYLRLMDGTSFSYTGDGTSGIYIWGAQLEQSSTVGEYIPTTSTINSAARFDHDPTTGESLGLLVEESRTNLLPSSEDVDYAGYQRAAITTSLDVATVTAPDGTTTADEIAPTATTEEHFIGYTTPANVTAGTAYTFSAYVKPNGTDSVRIRFAFAGFNNQNGSHVFSTNTTTSGNCDFKITPVANGWYRIQGTVVADSTAIGQPRIYPNENNSWLGVPSEALYVWGAQLEEGSFPTSYIPTTDATVTRAADVASISGSNFSSWYRQDEGTMLVSRLSHQMPLANFKLLYDFSDGTAANERHLALHANTNKIYAATVTGGSVTTTSAISTPILAGSTASAAQAWNATTFIASTQGINSNEPSVSGPQVINQLRIGARVTSVLVFTGTIGRITFWPQRLPDSTLSTITQ